MEKFLIILTSFLLLITAASIVILWKIRGSLRKIYTELNHLEYKVKDKSLPEHKGLNLNLFSEKIKKILDGMKSIKPEEE